MGRLDRRTRRVRGPALDGFSADVQAALDALRMPAVVVDGRGEVHLWNEVASRAFDWPTCHGGAATRPLPFARPGATWFARLRRLAAERGKPVSMTLRRKSGRERWLRCSAALMHLPRMDGAAFLLTFRDLTARRLRVRQHERDRDALREAAAQLRRARKMEALGLLAGGMAHDFNSIITAVRGHAQFLVDELPEANPSRADALEIRDAADRGARLARQLLAFGRRDNAEPQAIDLSAVVREATGLLLSLIREDIRLELELEPDLWPVRMDPGQVERVLMNLVVNARDAMPHGGTIRVCARNVAVPALTGRGGPSPGPCVALEVWDDGVGMSAATRTRIFEPFFTTKPPGEGTGLGLSTVYGIARKAGGGVTVESVPGRGALLRVLLPRDRSG